MSYADIFTLPDIELLLLSALQTAVIFSLVMAGLQIVGRRVFAQRNPQDLVIIVLAGEACGLGFTHEEAGFWGTIVSVVTLLLLGHMVERYGIFRKVLTKTPVVLYADGKLHQDLMARHMVDETDIEEVAREKSATTYKKYDLVILEGDGRISLVNR